MSKIKTVMRIIWSCCGTLLVAAVLLLAVLNFLSKPSGDGLFGYKGYTVISGSMEPTLKVGDYVVVKAEDFDQLQVGEIITFEDEGMMVTHRIISITDEGIQTRGDHNTVNDMKQVTEDKFVGRMAVHIPYLGHVMIWMQNPLIFAVVLGLIAVRIAFLILWKHE
ncbi:signal peptidase I [Enterococcus sp. 8G7_MSG3316]|uniref:Signal peptidase I n=1 Tax=Candidatus Enterococcus testudinis TaxID=1834191 RepID=A0A242A4S8_9ENTE|nr:signal peptidase I [Enterococcus sp. 8G7_MSG3316]OTN75962.1 signal peptidase I [Enterococcus sp. 8G7_MSG3316]